MLDARITAGFTGAPHVCFDSSRKSPNFHTPALSALRYHMLAHMRESEPTPEPGNPRIRASAVCVSRAQLLCVRLRDPISHVARLFVPGGAIEAGETAARAAARETLEETGYRVAIAPDSELVARYAFRWSGALFQVTTHFFRAQLLAPEAAPAEVHDADYHEGVCWLPLAQIPAELGFDRQILDAVQRLL